MKHDDCGSDVFIAGCEYLTNVCYALGIIMGGAIPQSFIASVVSGLADTSTRVPNARINSFYILATRVPNARINSFYTLAREDGNVARLGVMAGVTALLAVMRKPSSIKTVSDAGGVSALLRVLDVFGHHACVYEGARRALALLAPLNQNSRVHDVLESVLEGFTNH
jgi:hypothetical protein